MGQRRNPLLSLLALITLTSCNHAAPMLPTTTSAYLNTPAGYSQIAAKPKPKPSQGPQQPAVNVVLKGTVAQLLPTDNQGSRHQHFVMRSGNRDYKIAHNIDLAPVVPVVVGGAIEIKGDLIKSSPMDVLHWTHLDPANKHPHGYIRFAGQVYQ